jgi:hypothetical protein
VSDPETGPVIVLMYQFGGSRQLQRLLEDQPELAVTSATGLIGACHQAAYAWRQVEQRPAAPLSGLAAKSIRAMVAGAVSIITARDGRPRWCEIAPADRNAAETFLALYPSSRFICLHRACEDVVFAALRASRWGILGQEYAAYTASLPSGGQVPAVAAWWADHTDSLFTFEEDHPRICTRLRYEDFISDPVRTELRLREFLSLAENPDDFPRLPGGNVAPVLPEEEKPGCGADIPTGRIPPGILMRINELNNKLGYTPLAPTDTTPK